MARIAAKLVLASLRPSVLAQFYAYAMDSEIKPGLNNSHFLVVNTEGFEIQIYKPSQYRSWPKRGRALSLSLQALPSNQPVLTLNDWVRNLKSKGAKLITEVRLEFFGAEAWVADPEGNAFLLVVPDSKVEQI